MNAIELMAAVLCIVIIIFALVFIVLYIIDVTQTTHAIRRNYPVIGRFRYLFERLGEFFRQYFFAMDREEMPFNRALRSWVYRAAKDLDNTIAFGSTKDLGQPGTLMFVNCPYPRLEVDHVEAKHKIIGPYCETPYVTSSLFNISAMSYGAISRPAVLALSKGAKMAGCWLNTGEGGLSPYHLQGGADIVFQIGTAKYGVRNEAGNLSDEKLKSVAAHDQIKMIELKLSQGAKPGKGGILPGIKVTEEIAGIRGIPAGKDSISPNRHPEISNNVELLQMLNHIRQITGKPVGFKTVIGDYPWLDSLFGEINRQGIKYAPDFITVDSADGGSGAAPMPLMDDMGLPLRETLPMLVDKLEEYNLRDRIRVISSGKLITPTFVAGALCMGTDFVVSARGFMFALGCIQAMQCNKNTCPTGITTHDHKLQRGLDIDDKAVRVMHYAKNMMREVGTIAHSCGVESPQQLRRVHCRIVTSPGKSKSMADLYPEYNNHIESTPL